MDGGRNGAARGSDDPAGSDASSPSPSPSVSEPVTTSPSEGSQAPAPSDPSACDSEVRHSAEVGTIPQGLERVSHVAFDASTTWLYSDGRIAVVCDDWPAAQSGGTPTLTAPPPVRPALTRSELMISQNFGPSGEAQYFADGPRIPGVTSIQYSFPDADGWGDGGHLVRAVITDDMWAMQFVRRRMPPGLPAGPVKIAVGVADGSLQGYQLSELQLCAQINHGC